MYDFCYATKRETREARERLISIIREVQNVVRNEFTFQYMFVGSSSRNLITYDRKSNVGYDFDINFYVNYDDQNYSPKKIRTIIRKAIDKVALKYGYDYCEDSTRVLTIKYKEYKNAKILHSCDFAIVNDCEEGQRYIRFNKGANTYTWEFQSKGFDALSEKIKWLKDNDLWTDLKDYYIEKKNYNNNPDKHSRSIFAESVNEMCRRNGYSD